MKQGQGAARVSGAPVTYGLTIPSQAHHPAAAAGFAAFLFGDSGRRLFERRGFHPVLPVQCVSCVGLPDPLRLLVTSAAQPHAPAVP